MTARWRARAAVRPAEKKGQPASRLLSGQRLLRSRLERRDTLVDMVHAVSATIEPADIADAIVERLAEWMPAPCWAVVAADHSGQLAVLGDRDLDPAAGPAIYAVASWVMEHRRALVSVDLRADERVSDSAVGTVVALPLACRGNTIGALVGLDRAASPRAARLAPAVMRALSILLEPAAFALDSALLFKRAEAMSVTDDLTQLYNSRYLNQALRHEIKRTARSGRAVSLLFIDLDGFKSVNDTYGHLAGSRTLAEAAGILRGSARETDVVARYGGDEFAIILPDTGAPGAVAVGERIRSRLADHHFLAGDGLDIRLTASVGIATLPDVAGNAEGLVQAADTAMYQVKARGKNGVQSAASPADT